MFASYSSGEYQSVIFFLDGKPDREMTYPEFEAVLDNFVPLPSYANQLIQSVVLGINGQLQIISANFFLLGFDENGNADHKWNVPLQQLIDQAAAGPDLGAGPIKLCCRSLCPLEWHQKELWDPDLQASPNHFEQLRQRVKQNRLGFKQLAFAIDDMPKAQTALELTIPTLGNSLPDVPTIHADYVSNADAADDLALAQSLINYLRKKLSSEIMQSADDQRGSHQLEIASLQNQHKDALAKLAQEHSDELRVYDAEIGKLHRQLQDALKEHQQLSLENEQLQQQLEQLKSQVTQNMLQTSNNEAQDLQKIEEHIAQELQIQSQRMHLQYQQTLQTKEVENTYLREKIVLMEQELAEVHRDQARTIEQAGDDFISLLKQHELNIVAFHPGAGTITVPLNDVGRYLENSTAYVAELCQVSESDYRAWVDHYQTPECTEHSQAKGERCGKKLRRVDVPSQFISGRSDRCPLHWSFQQS